MRRIYEVFIFFLIISVPALIIIDYTSLPRMAVNEEGKCEYLLVIENDQEVRKGCEVAREYPRHETFNVLSSVAQEELRKKDAEQCLLRHEMARARGAR